MIFPANDNFAGDNFAGALGYSNLGKKLWLELGVIVSDWQ